MKKNLLKTVIWIALIAVLFVGAYTGVRAYQAPLAAELSLPEQSAPVGAKSSAVEVQTSTGVCGQTGAMNVLFIGSDTSIGNPPYGADVVRLVRVDFDNQKITAVTFPRDMVVDTAALKDPNQVKQPLGLTFHLAGKAATGSTSEKTIAASNVMAQVLLDDFGVRPDHYLTVALDSVAGMIDTVGGVEITLSEKITTERDVTFEAGKQTLTGAKAAEFVRAIEPGGDAARTQRQNDFIKALQQKVTSASILPKVPTLLTQFKDAIVTDLSPEQLVSFSCLAQKVTDDKVELIGLNTSKYINGVDPNIEAIKALLTEKFAK